jgi:hypothetical protein
MLPFGTASQKLRGACAFTFPERQSVTVRPLDPRSAERGGLDEGRWGVFVGIDWASQTP